VQRPQTPTPQSGAGPPLEVRIAYLLSRIGQGHAARFAELLAPLGLRARQFALLNLVDLAAGSSQQRLGELMGLDPSGLVSAIDELERQGLLERRRDPSDRRRHALFLTRAGKAKLTRARQASQRRSAELLAPLSAAEAQALHELLRRIAGDDETDVMRAVDRA
jgi:DNA-binding MarR family transcriptional regulator